MLQVLIRPWRGAPGRTIRLRPRGRQRQYLAAQQAVENVAVDHLAFQQQPRQRVEPGALAGQRASSARCRSRRRRG
ncbi:hypothetical protein BKK81_33880 (plasmid) [Cupriavidus sp. USMAHM13]|nr:hypothetical protein BKK81_33880 [Cupriavidus sp. USMAHM13]